MTTSTRISRRRLIRPWRARESCRLNTNVSLSAPICGIQAVCSVPEMRACTAVRTTTGHSNTKTVRSLYSIIRFQASAWLASLSNLLKLQLKRFVALAPNEGTVFMLKDSLLRYTLSRRTWKVGTQESLEAYRRCYQQKKLHRRERLRVPPSKRSALSFISLFSQLVMFQPLLFISQQGHCLRRFIGATRTSSLSPRPFELDCWNNPSVGIRGSMPRSSQLRALQLQKYQLSSESILKSIAHLRYTSALPSRHTTVSGAASVAKQSDQIHGL